MKILKTALTVLLLFTLLSSYADNTKKSQIIAEDELIFCVTGDSRGKDKGVNQKVLVQLVNALKKENPVFVAVNGDLVSGYSSKLENELINWRDTFMAPLIDAGIKVYPCRGNHDANGSKTMRLLGLGKNAPLQIWQKVFSGKFALPENGPKDEKGVTYFVKDKNILLLLLDSYGAKKRHIVDNSWIEEVLKKEKGTQSLHLFAVAHEPAFSVHHKDCLASVPKARDRFIKTFMTNGGVCFFCGHDHFYNHAKVALPQGELRQFVCGTAGAPLYKWKGKYADKRVTEIKTEKAFGYMIVKIKGKQATLIMKAWNEKGELEVIDTFTYTLKK